MSSFVIKFLRYCRALSLSVTVEEVSGGGGDGGGGGGGSSKRPTWLLSLSFQKSVPLAS